MPDFTAQVNALGALRFLDAIRETQIKTKFYQASTSELYGKVQEIPQKETTPFYPRSPYGVAKLYAYWTIVNYREAYNLFACNGILFNHESPRRGETFITRKITLAAARIKLGMQDKLILGNLNSIRDWGYAPEYVEGMWRMLQKNNPGDYVLATGKKCTVRDFTYIVFKELGFELAWEGEGEFEVGIDINSREILVEVSPKYFRPTEVDLLIGDPKKAYKELGWKAKTNFKSLARIMAKADYEKVKKRGF